MRKETIEEFAERYAQSKSSSSVFQEAHKKDFIQGYNFAQQQNKSLYSEEDVLEIVFKIYDEFGIYISKESALKQFKKK